MPNLDFEKFILGAIEKVEFIQGLGNELAKMSATNHLKGYLEGGYELFKMMMEKE